jgi:hypothetical protein
MLHLFASRLCVHLFTPPECICCGPCSRFPVIRIYLCFEEIMKYINTLNTYRYRIVLSYMVSICRYQLTSWAPPGWGGVPGIYPSLRIVGNKSKFDGHYVSQMKFATLWTEEAGAAMRLASIPTCTTPVMSYVPSTCVDCDSSRLF